MFLREICPKEVKKEEKKEEKKEYCPEKKECDVQVYNCHAPKKVIKHKHVVKHHHDIENEYEVIHEHDYYYTNVVNEKEIVKHHNDEVYKPNYCDRYKDCDCKCND